MYGTLQTLVDMLESSDADGGASGGETEETIDKIMSLVNKMVDEDDGFPLQKDAFVEGFGEWPVRLNHKRVVSVADIFEHVEEAEFETKVAFHRATGTAMRRADLWEYHPKE